MLGIHPWVEARHLPLGQGASPDKDVKDHYFTDLESAPPDRRAENKHKCVGVCMCVCVSTIVCPPRLQLWLCAPIWDLCGDLFGRILTVSTFRSSLAARGAQQWP